MEIICSNCQEELSFSGGVFCCPVCGRDWSEILLDGNKYYDSAIEREYNSIIAYEYAIFKDLIKNKQIYGLLFQVKDVYEVITRIPVLITASFFFNNPALRNDGVNDFFLVNMLRKRQLNKNSIDIISVIKLINKLKKFFLGRFLRKFV